MKKSIIKKIARENLFIGTIETRKSDCLNYYDLHIDWIKEALQAAYEAGRASK